MNLRKPTDDDYEAFNKAADKIADDMWKAFLSRVNLRARIITELPLATAKQIALVTEICKDVYISGISQGAESALHFQVIGKRILKDEKPD